MNSSKQPFFSLITPVYNIERLIAATIESALSQTFTDWEMILVDDGSPDGAGKICDEYAAKDNRISVIHKQNEGLAAARNTGIEACSGKYFLIFEGSDLFPSNDTLEKVYETLCEKEVDIYFGKLQDVLETGLKVIGEQKDYCVNGFYEKGGKNLFEKLCDNEDVLALSSPVNKLFRTSFVKDNGLWFCKGIYHDDDEWLPRTIVLSKSAYFTNEVIYSALTWDGCFGQAASDKSLTKKACDKMFLALRCCEDIEKRFPKSRDSFIKKYYEYYVRIYLDGAAALKKYNSVFKYARRSVSRNLRILGWLQFVLGTRFAVKLFLKRC